MHITPLDIRKQTFSKKIWGYDIDEVKNFMEMISSELESTNRENHDFAEKLKVVESELGMYKKIEQNLQDTLMTAQRITDEIKINAQKEAELIIKEAQIRAHKERETAREKVLKFEEELTTIKHQKEMFISRFRSMVNTQLEMLNILESDSDFNRTRPAEEKQETKTETANQSDRKEQTAHGDNSAELS